VAQTQLRLPKRSVLLATFISIVGCRPLPARFRSVWLIRLKKVRYQQWPANKSRRWGKPSKKKSRELIDGTVALLMGLGISSETPVGT
jgi:hypothetical protein